MTLELSLDCTDAARARRLMKVLSPDNQGVPTDQRFGARQRGSKLHFSITSPRLMPALSTLESILSDARLFEEVARIAT